MSLPVALGLYTVRDLYHKDFDACLARTAALGFAGVECFGEPTLPPDEVAGALTRHSLQIVGWHMPIDQLEGDALPRTLSYLTKLGCKRIIIPYMPPEAFATRASTLAFAARLNAIRTRVSQQGFSLGYHNHTAEFMPLEDGTLPWALLMDNTGVIAQLDTGNALASGTPGCEAAELVALWPGRATTVHAKPYSRADHFATMIGEDDIDWAAFLYACGRTGGTEWLIVEYESDHLEPFEAATLCLRALEKLG